MSHTPTPYRAVQTRDCHGRPVIEIVSMDGQSIADCLCGGSSGEEHNQSGIDDGDFIATACNAHEALVNAAMAMLVWGDRECMPQGGANDAPFELLESALKLAGVSIQ